MRFHTRSGFDLRPSGIPGFAQNWISNIERGQRDPSWASVTRLAGGLGVSLTKLVETAESLVERYGDGPYEALDFTRSRSSATQCVWNAFFI